MNLTKFIIVTNLKVGYFIGIQTALNLTKYNQLTLFTVNFTDKESDLELIIRLLKINTASNKWRCITPTQPSEPWFLYLKFYNEVY